MAAFLIIAAFVLMTVGYIWLLYQSSQISLGWFILIFFIPFAGLFFSIQYWEDAKKPFLLTMFGLCVLFGGFVTADKKMSKLNNLEGVELVREEESSEESSEDDSAFKQENITKFVVEENTGKTAEGGQQNFPNTNPLSRMLAKVSKLSTASATPGKVVVVEPTPAQNVPTPIDESQQQRITRVLREARERRSSTPRLTPELVPSVPTPAEPRPTISFSMDEKRSKAPRR